MSRTLADVDVDAVCLDNTGDYTWKDMAGTVLCRRRRDGRIYSLGSIGAHEVKVFGDCLGTSADEPWRKADAGQPGSLADAHDRIDALQARVDKLEQRPSVPDMAKINEQLEDQRALIQAAHYRVTLLELASRNDDITRRTTPPPAKQTQPPDVAVYEREDLNGMKLKYTMLIGCEMDRPELFSDCTRTVLDAFDRLGWDELRTKYGITHRVLDDGTWVLYRAGFAINRDYKSEREALTAAAIIAAHEAWKKEQGK